MSKKSTHQISFTEYDHISELDDQIQKLVILSKRFADDAYAPYSNFKVGAAILLEGGEMVGGNNQENRAFPSGLCAERVAVFSASANHPNSKVMAVGIYTQMEELISPCGSCRQALLEYEIKQGTEIEVYLLNKHDRVRKFDSVSDLLPFGFKYNNFIGQ